MSFLAVARGSCDAFLIVSKPTGRIAGMLLNEPGKIGRAAKAEILGNLANGGIGIVQQAARAVQDAFVQQGGGGTPGLRPADTGQVRRGDANE